MKINIKISLLTNMLKKISGGIKKNDKTSILSHVLIKVFKNNILCTSINEEIEIITYDILNDLTTEGEFIVKYDIIYNICKTNDLNSIISITKKHNSIEISSNNSIFKIPCLHNQIFPSLENDTNTLINIKIDNKLLKNLFKNSHLAASDNNPRLFLNGILLEINKNNITTLSSNGFRLFFSHNTINNNNDYKKIKIILPKILLGYVYVHTKIDFILCDFRISFFPSSY